MRLVVDSSVIVSVCLAGGSLGPLDGHELHGPAHLAAEVTSVLRELTYRSEVPLARGSEAVSHLGRLPVSYERPGAHAAAAFQLAEQLGWAKTYDAEYVALAMNLEAALVTLDARLRRTAGAIVTVMGPEEL